MPGSAQPNPSLVGMAGNGAHVFEASPVVSPLAWDPALPLQVVAPLAEPDAASELTGQPGGSLVLQPDDLTGQRLPGELLVLPGTPEDTLTLTFEWSSREAGYDNEVGFFLVNDNGAVDGVAPDDANYAHTALTDASRQVLFKSGQGAGAVKTLTFSGGDRLAFYLIQDDTTDRWISRSADQQKLPRAFFSLDSANSDTADHLRHRSLAEGVWQFAWEDQFGGGDRDFNDVVFTVATGPRLLEKTPGDADQLITTKVFWVERNARYQNELGLFLVDDENGRIGALLPHDEGYAQAALSADRRQVVFASGQTEGAVAELALPGDTYFGWYLIQDASTETFLSQNPNNELGQGPLAFFSLHGTNPDDFKHLQQQAPGQYGWEDLVNGGDRDFNDLIFRYEFESLELPQLSIDDVQVTEGSDAAARFTVSLSEPSGETVTVDYAVAAGTAVAGQDYGAQTGTLTFAPGEIQQILPILITDDNQAEDEEFFLVNLSNAVNGTLADAQGRAAIADDDVPTVDLTLVEGSQFQVVASEPITVPAEPSTLQITFADLSFDQTDPNSINDAFELALVDEAGNSLVYVLETGRDAFFNWTEGEGATLANGVTLAGETITVNLAGIAPETAATLILRLVNNDRDETTTVRITNIAVAAADVTPPTGVTPTASALAADAPPAFATLSDVSASMAVAYGQTSFNETTQRLYADVAVHNGGQYRVDGPLLVAVDNLSDPAVQVLGADGFTPDGLPYYLVNSAGGDTLAPGATTEQTTLVFSNPAGEQFTYDLVVLGHLNEAPEIVSEPNLEGLIGKPYRYGVEATDPEGDPVTYDLVVAPEGMTIDPETGEIEWAPQEANRGSQSITVQAADGRGGVTTQSFDLVVGDAPPNRPPVFTTGPVVDARVNTAYEYDADATDLDYDELTFALVDGPEGMVVDPATGVVSWTPTAEQINGENGSEHPVMITVADGNGGVAVQNYVVNVLPEGSNHDPVIVSEPETTLTIPPDYQGKIWNFAEDFELKLPQVGNGEDNAWFYYRAEPEDQDGTYTLFDAAGPGVHSSNYAHWGPNAFHLIGTRFDGTGFVVPGTFNYNNPESNPEPDAIVGFRAPTSATYSISGLFKDLDGTDFDAPSDQRGVLVDITTTKTPGVAGSDISIVEFDSALIDASNTNEWMRTELGNPEVLPDEAPFDFDIFLEEGQTLFFRVNDLGSNRFDSTQLEIEIGDIVTYEYDVDAIDPDDDALAYSLLEAPEGMEIDESTGEISWSPTAEQVTEVDEFSVSVLTEDGRGGSDEQSFKIQIETGDPQASGEIRGKKFNDLNADGLYDSSEGESGLEDWIIYIDSNDNGQRDADEPFTSTDADGNYIFTNLSSGSYVIREENQPEYVQTFPNTGDTNLLLNGSFEEGVFAGSFRSIYPATQGIADWTVSNEAVDYVGSYWVASDGERTVDLYGSPGKGTLSQTFNTIPGEEYLVTFDLAGNLAGSPTIKELEVKAAEQSAEFVFDVAGTTTSNMGWRTETFQFTAAEDTTTLSFRGTNSGAGYGPVIDNVIVQELSPNTGHVVALDEGEVIQGIDFGNQLTGETVINSDPVFVSEAMTFAKAGTLFRYDANAQDADGDTLTYDLSLAPDGMVIDPASGIVVWNPTIDQLGIHDVILRVQDGSGGVDLQAFQVTVGTNSAPAITSTPPNPAVIGVPYEYPVTAQDADGDDLTFQLDDAPAGVDIDEDTGVVSFTPQREFFDDEAFDQIKDTWNIEGFDEITPGRNAISSDTFADKGLTIVQRDGHDMNIVSNSDQSYVGRFAPNNPSSAPNALSSSAAPDEPQFGYDDVTDNYDFIFSEPVYAAGLWIGNIAPGSTEIQFLASDGSIIASEAFDQNHPGLISFGEFDNRIFYGARSDRPIERVRAIEPAGDNDGIVFDDIQWSTDSSNFNEFEFDIVVGDGNGGETLQAVDLDLIDPAVTPVVNHPPSIANTPRSEIGLGDDYVFQIEASDPDNDPLTYSLITAPAGMTIDDDGLVQWPADATELGDYSFTVQVEDGRGAGLQATYNFSVVQQTVNSAPIITSTPGFVAVIGDQYRYDAEATDPDNDPIAWSLVSGPTGLSLDEATGQVSWTPTADQLGFHEVIIDAIDAQGASFRQGFGLNISSTNTPPTVTSAPPTLAFSGTPYTYALTASDLNGDALTYRLTVAPVGMAIDASTGLIEWTPTAEQLGTQTVTVSIADGQGGFAEQSYTLDVASEAQNLPPQLTSQPSFGATADQLYTYQLTATDPENLTLRYELLQGPEGMSLDATTGVLTWTPTAAQLGSHPVKVATFDPLDLGASQTFTLTVGDGNQNPVLNNTPSTTALIGDTYAFDLNVTDPDGDVVTYTLVTGPEGMTLDELGRLRWTPTGADVGPQPVDLLVEDGRGGNFTFGYDLTVIADTTAPQVVLDASSNFIDVNEPVTVQVRATDDVAVESIGLTVDGTPVALDSTGSATLNFDAVGSVALVATALDTAGNAASTDFALAVVDANDTDAPIVSILTPASGGAITSFVDVVGTVTDDNLTGYTLTATPFAGGPTTVLAEGTSEVTADVLGRFDGTLLRNDSYILELTATDAGGNTASTSTLVDVEGDLKVGNYTLSFVDLSIPLTGIPIVVSRTYDTLNANVSDDFGYGWSMDLRDTDLTDNVGKSGLEDVGTYNAFFDGAAVYVTLPNGQREKFIFQPEARGLFGLTTYKPRFVAADGDNTTVLTVDDIDLQRTADGRYETLSRIPYNPASKLISSTSSGNYTLTTQDGIRYTIDGDSGDLERITDRNGNTLTYTEAGVFSSTGQQVTFERDPQGRITAVIDPEGNRITYEYDALGDLVAVRDREGNTTQFDYDDEIAHFLEDVIDPLGRSGIRSEYQDGRLVKLFDFDGNEVELIHDPDNFVETVEDQFGNPTVYEYDDRGNVLTELDALGNITRRTYDSNDNMLTEIVEKDGTVFESMTFTYDSRNNVLSETDALGNATYFTYDSFGNVLTTTDPSGQTVTNTYDANGNLAKIEGQATGPLTLSYDSAGNLKSLTDSVGTTTFEYFSDGNVKSQTDALGTVTTYTYDNNGNQETETTTQTTPDGVLTLVTTMEYDDEGRVVKVTDADGNVSETVYDANGNRVEEIDALGRSTKYIYDERGQLIEIIYPDETPDDLTDNPRTRSEYDEAGRVIAEYDELGRATRTVYDELGRVTETLYADGTPDDLTDNPRTQTEYDAAGRVTAQIDERGNRTEFIYDEAGRLLETIYPDDTPDDVTDNPRFTTVYDDAGRQILQTDALGQTTQFFYDELGRSTSQQYDDGTTSSVEYDDAGRVVAQTDQENKTTRFEYDDLGRLEAVIDALNQRTEYTYDEQGNLLTQKDANGNITRYEYDELGRRTATVLPEGQRSITIYDVLGNPISSTDFNGDNIIYQYDERYRLITKDLPGEEFDEAYTYYDNGLLETVTDERGITRYSYDERNRLTQRQDPDGTTIAYSYDEAGNRTAVTIPSGTTNYTFDAQNRLETVTDPDGGVTTYFYNPVGNLEHTEFPNGTVEIREYDSLNRLVYIENSGPNGIINSFRYTLNAAGHRTAVDEHNGRRVEYTYDDLYRLTAETIYDPSATAPSRTIEYVYDEVGNRLSRDDSAEGTTLYTYDNNDRLETATTNGVATTYSYDNNGNTTSNTTNGNTVTYNWNADNRLISADTDGDGTVDVVNQYNQNGIRVSQTVNGEETRFLIDENRPYAQVLEEYTPGGIIKVSYVHGNDLLLRKQGNEQLFHHVDALGSTRTLTNMDGIANVSYIYDAYGKIINSSGLSKNDFLFSGEQRDSVLRLDYLRARYLDPDLGRFLSQDPFIGFRSLPQSRHKYQYVYNDPINLLDPSGKTPILLGQTFKTAIIAGLTVGTINAAPVFVKGDADNSTIAKAFASGFAGGFVGIFVAAYLPLVIGTIIGKFPAYIGAGLTGIVGDGVLLSSSAAGVAGNVTNQILFNVLTEQDYADGLEDAAILGAVFGFGSGKLAPIVGDSVPIAAQIIGSQLDEFVTVALAEAVSLAVLSTKFSPRELILEMLKLMQDSEDAIEKKK